MAVNSTGGAIASAEKILRISEHDTRLAAGIKEDPKLSRDLLPPFVRYNAVRSAAVAKQWRRVGRQTLAIHPAVVEETRLATSNKISCEVLRALPYINPMVVYAEPPTVDSWTKLTGQDHGHSGLYRSEEAAMRLLGFTTYAFSVKHGMKDEEKLKLSWHDLVNTTHDPDAEYFGAMVFFEVLDTQGKVIDTEVNSFSFLFSENMTLAELVEDQAGRFAFHTGSTTTNDPNAKKWIRQVLKIILGSLFYLCSTTLDAERVPANATRHLAKTIARKPLSLYRVGWSLGAALTRYRQERRDSENPSQMGDIRHQQDPQHRRAHFKTVWTGKGSLVPKTVYVAPYWTHVERLGETGINTLRKVPKIS